MLCSKCHKNEAVICYTEIVGGIRHEQYLCAECAAGYTAFDAERSMMTPERLLAGLLTSVLGQAGIGGEDDAKKTNLVCPSCHMTYNEFLKHSRFGCADCVHTFGFLLDDYLKKIQGDCRHTGKQYTGRETVSVPDFSAVGQAADMYPEHEVQSEDHISVLKERLAAAVKEEAYEEAARLRDRIRELKAKEEAADEKMV